MISNLCEENHWQLTESLQNLLNLKLLYDAGVDVKSFGSFVLQGDMEWSRCYDIFLFGANNLFDKASQVEAEKYDYMDGIAVDVTFNNLFNFYEQIPNAEQQIKKLISKRDVTIHPDKKGFRVEVFDAMAEEITENLSFLIRFRNVINERIKEKAGKKQWRQRSA